MRADSRLAKVHPHCREHPRTDQSIRLEQTAEESRKAIARSPGCKVRMSRLLMVRSSVGEPLSRRKQEQRRNHVHVDWVGWDSGVGTSPSKLVPDGGMF